MAILEGLDQSVQVISRGLEARARRQAAIAANVANADTPGYRAVDVPFARALEQASGRLALAATDGRHFGGLGAPVEIALVLSGGLPRRDGNDVNIDAEMTKLARNQIEYQFLARALGGKFRRIREAISGRASA